MARWKVAALYCFVKLDALDELQISLKSQCVERGIVGTLLLAREGINGTIAGPDAAITDIEKILRTLPGCEDMDVKYSWAREQPFGRMKVRIKKEIVTMGVPGLDPLKQVGTYVSPQDWNALISQPDVLLVDTRNDYEVAIGTFKGAIDPDIQQFRDFPQWFDDWRSSLENAGKTAKVAMFCTGGIRCEKSTAFARSQGIQDVYHLKGGILRYLEEIPASDSLWQGECFVFDERVSVGHQLAEGSYHLCRQCGWPEEKEIPHQCPQEQKKAAPKGGESF